MLVERSRNLAGTDVLAIPRAGSRPQPDDESTCLLAFSFSAAEIGELCLQLEQAGTQHSLTSHAWR